MSSSMRSNWSASSKAVQTALAPKALEEQSMSTPLKSRSIALTRMNGVSGFFHSSWEQTRVNYSGTGGWWECGTCCK